MASPQVAFSGGVAIFPTAEDFCLFAFGPPDHSAHVRAWRLHRHNVAYHAAADAGDAACRRFIAETSSRKSLAEERAR